MNTVIAQRQSVERLIGGLKSRFADRITGHIEQPAQAARFAPTPPGLDARLIAALRARGIEQLYSHQAQAFATANAGQHTVVVTPTASGKTLCYNLPVIQSVLEQQAKALYLFPTKALAQDQVSELLAINRAAELNIRAYTFDGDTPSDARRAVRTRGDVVVSNPDMLHQGILPHHTKWAQLFESLRYVVIDELHTYRGVFGSHVANVLRRLLRICAFYQSRPTFICCSATIANPGALAEQLLAAPVKVIDDNGAPRGSRHLLLWNPPVVNVDLGIRASARSQTTTLAKETVAQGLKTIVFAQTRLMVEVLTKYLKERFDHDPRKPPRIKAYRGGYLPNERRAVERELRSSKIDCVVSTSALELGVDIGMLDACLLNGYPGTVSATWQRLGRAGRRQKTALGVLVASSQALDQYVVNNPDFFAQASPEHARIAPDQMMILLDHIRCAAFELPFMQGESFGGTQIADYLAYLADEGSLQGEGNRWHWIGDDYPACGVSLRSVANGNFLVIDRLADARTVLAEVDYASAPLTLYEGAIYLIQSKPYQVEKLDWVGRKAYVIPTQVDYYTDAIDFTRLKILETFTSGVAGRAECALGEVHLVRRIPGYKKIRYHTHENVGYGPIDLPDQEMHTQSLWWQLPPAVLESLFAHRWQALDGLLGAAQALHTTACVAAMAEPRDLGKAVGSGSGDGTWQVVRGVDGEVQVADASGDRLAAAAIPLFSPGIFVYDNYPGGMGTSEGLYERSAQLVEQALTLVAGCSCERGCPACVGPVNGDNPRADTRRSALTVLQALR